MVKKIMRPVSLVLILLLLVTGAFFAGCKGQVEVRGLRDSIEVVDGEESIIELAGPAERIIVLAPSVLEIIDGLGAMDQVVEVGNVSVELGDSQAEGFEGVGDSQSLNIEKIVELNPDILITITGGPDDDYKKVEELGIEIYRVIDVRGIEGVYEEIANISKIVGLENKGEELNSELREGVNEIYGRVKDLSDEQRPKVFYEVWNDPLYTAGADTFINDLIGKSGGINIAAEDNLTGWPEYSVETLIVKNPDVIIAPISMAVDPSVIIEDQRLSSINAVINNKVYVIPDNPISRPNQNLIKALQMLSKAIHPEIFGEFEIIE